ncbi:MAG: dihydrofolate reductase [Pseudomonadota bacterium]
MKISMIVALGENGVIGRDGELPWRLSDDLKFFKKVTMGKPVIMGRKTYDSIGKALPGRANIVVTRQSEYQLDDAIVVRDLDAAIDQAISAAEGSQVDEVFIIGGGEIYRAALNRANRLYLTRVKASPVGDAYFPEIDVGQWSSQIEGHIQKGPKNDHDAELVTLDRLPLNIPLKK